METFWMIGGGIFVLIALGMYWLLGREWKRSVPHPEEGKYRRGAP